MVGVVPGKTGFLFNVIYSLAISIVTFLMLAAALLASRSLVFEGVRKVVKLPKTKPR